MSTLRCQPGRPSRTARHCLPPADLTVCMHACSQDYNTPCYEGKHLLVALLVAVPGVVLFALGVPIGSAWFLRRKRDMLEDSQFSLKYGFVYEGECVFVVRISGQAGLAHEMRPVLAASCSCATSGTC
jgi:hypothetical protein